MPSKPLLHCALTPFGDTLHTNANVLGRVLYGSCYLPPTIAHHSPFLSLPLMTTRMESFTECWLSEGKITTGSEGALHYAYDGEYFFGAYEIPRCDCYQKQTQTAYLAVFKLIEQLGYAKLFRIWNFIPHINQPNSNGLEIYRDFCVGRAQAIEHYYANAKMPMPAATAVGLAAGNLAFYLLACRTETTIHLENPRQLPAYTYPKQYSPRSPNFSRATCLTNQQTGVTQFYISGTASIIGHQTLWLGKVAQQCDIALENIALLLSDTNVKKYGLAKGIPLTKLDVVKVYLRYNKDRDIVQRKCAEQLSSAVKIHFITADICRSDLLVEIEAIGTNQQ